MFRSVQQTLVGEGANHKDSCEGDYLCVCFVCVYASSTLPFIAVSNRFSRCLAMQITVFARFDRYLNLFRSITKHWSEIISYLKKRHRAHKQHKYPYASFVCTLPFIAVSNRFGRCLNLFQSITKHWS